MSLSPSGEERPSALLYYSHPHLLLTATVEEIIDAHPDSDIGSIVQQKD